jgi:ABC-type lipoprotein export system ATPase subunit
VNENQPIVIADDVERWYPQGIGSRVVLSRASLVVRGGDRLALLGPSGSGKTTLLSLLAGIDTPTKGTVSWPGCPANSTPRPAYVGMVFQDPNLLPTLNIEENVALPLILAGHPDASARRQARKRLALLGLDGLEDRLPDDVSSGQAQRAAVARAVICEPALILADEPTGQLDPEAAATTVAALLDAAAGSDRALVLATHDRDVAALLATNRYIADGRILNADYQPVRADRVGH